MKKLKHINLIKSIASSVCLLGASAGIIFGVSAGRFSIDYVNLDNPANRLNAALNYNYYNQNIKSEWNMLNVDEHGDPLPVQADMPTSQYIDPDNWKALHGKDTPIFHDENAEQRTPFSPETPEGEEVWNPYRTNRNNFVGMALDGSSHVALDRSFNQSLYQGLLNFVHNKNTPITSDAELNVLKPSQDTNVALQEVYRAFADDKDGSTRVLGLAGFPHVSPLEGLGSFDPSTGLYNFIIDPQFNKMCIILIDGSIRNNQNIASVLFRSDQAGFLAAVSTAMYFINNAHVYHENYQTLSVGTYGGTPLPTVLIYMGGFQRGIEFFNHFVLKGMLRDARSCLEYGREFDPETEQLLTCSKYADEIQQWYDNPAGFDDDRKNELINEDDQSGLLFDEYKVEIVRLGKFDTNFTGSFAQGDGIGITKQLLNRGVSAIMSVAGPQTTDSVQEVYNQNSKCIVVGVDAAMEDGDSQKPLKNPKFADKTRGFDGSVPTYADKILKFSAIKDMSTVTEKIARLCMLNQNFDIPSEDDDRIPDPDLAVCNIGYQTCGNIQNGLTSVSWDGWVYLIEALSHIALPNLETFEIAWVKAVNDYFEENGWFEEGTGEPIEEYKDFYDNVRLFDPTELGTGVATFLKYKGVDPTTGEPIPTAMYANFSHVIAILGRILSDQSYLRLEFPENITLVLPQTPEEEETWVPEIATEPQHGSILDWLKYNMYYIS